MIRAGQPRGLDELMIVNPVSSGARVLVIVRVAPPRQTAGEASTARRWFLGADGTLYELRR